MFTIRNVCAAPAQQKARHGDRDRGGHCRAGSGAATQHTGLQGRGSGGAGEDRFFFVL